MHEQVLFLRGELLVFLVQFLGVSFPHEGVGVSVEVLFLGFLGLGVALAEELLAIQVFRLELVGSLALQTRLLVDVDQELVVFVVVVVQHAFCELVLVQLGLSQSRTVLEVCHLVLH